MRVLVLVCTLAALVAIAGCGAELGLLIERRGLYYFDDLPYGFTPSNGYWHHNYCWYEGFWYHEGRSTPYGWQFASGEPYLW